jgi:hypothetical protein
MRLIHLNTDFDRMIDCPSIQGHVMQSLREAKNIKKHTCRYADLFWFFWYAKLTNGQLLRKHVDSMCYADLQTEVESVFFLFKHNDVYIIETGSTRRLVSRPKTDLSVVDNLRDYVTLRRDYMLHGERLNCPAHISESLPCLWRPGYYNYVSCKIHAKSKPAKSGDGIEILDESIDEVEVKYTASGGVRQTFSPAQFHSKFFVLSVDREDLDQVSRTLLESSDTFLPISFYECGPRFAGALKAEVEAKKKRKGTGRYEMSNMIEKIETNTLYEQKDTMNVKL